MTNLSPHTPNPRVLFAISNIAVGGGAEKVITTIANEFLERGIDSCLLTFYTSEVEHEYRGERISNNERTPSSFLKKLPRAWQRVRLVARSCRERNINVVISFLEESNYYVLLAKMLFRLPVRVIVSVRNDPRAYPWLYRFLIRRLYPRAAHVVAVTKTVAHVLREEFGLQNVSTIYNPIDLEAVEARAAEPLPREHEWLRERSPLCISIGRLAKQKGQWHMIRAFTKVCETYPDATLVILGEGPYREKLQALINRAHMQDNIFLLGKQENVYPFLAAADLFLFTSLWEGMPNTVIEAMAVGLPIVAADCESGPREIIAPQLAPFEKVTYPYTIENGVLTKPLKIADAHFDTATQSPLSESEQQFANMVLLQMSQVEARDGHYLHTDPFRLTHIIQEWKTLLL